MTLRLLAVLAASLIAFATITPTQAQQSAADSATVASPLVDSLKVTLERFKSSNPPTTADSAQLRRWADSVQVRGNSIRKTNSNEARSLLRSTLRARRTLGDSAGAAAVIEDIGVSYFYQSRYEQALASYRKALKVTREIGNREGLASALHKIGIIEEYRGRYDEALASYRKTLKIARETGDREGIAHALNSIGLAYQNQSRYEEALSYYQKSLQIKREIGNPNDIANTLHNIGLIQADQGRYERAVIRYREALETFREIGNRDGISGALNNIGLVYQNQGRYEEALSHYQESLQIKREIGNPRGVARTLNNIGLIHAHQGRYDEALSYYQESLQIKREIGNREGIARTLNNIGLAHAHQGRRSRALAHYREALEINQAIARPRGSARNLKNIGDLHLQKGVLSAATDTLDRALRLTERLRANATSPDARRSLFAMEVDGYRALTTAYVRAGKPDSALRSVEQARARLLADRLAGTAQGDTSFSIPSVEELRRTLDSGETALLYANADTDQPLTAIVVTGKETHARELPDSTVRAEIEQAYPTRLNRLRREEGPLTEALGTDASPGAAEEGPPSLAEAIRLYRYYLVRSSADASVQKDLSRRLRELLVGPIADPVSGAEKLTVVPTGALGYLPFETLRDSSGTYLVEDTGVRYAQSLTVRRQLQQREYVERERPLLALGGAAYTPDETKESGSFIAEARRGSTRVATDEHASTLLRSAETRMEQGKSPRPTYQQLGYAQWPDLPGTQSEVEQLGNIAGEGATIITGAGASEDSVRILDEQGQLRAYRHVHFATHGIAVPETPKLSALVLSQIGASDSLAARDGYLTMEEIADLEMQADVAVLSACQTGLGKVVAGEGVVSLSHAFLRAGANATLVSQWKVLDESTRQFMRAVYEKAQDEETSFAEAVTLAKRAFIGGEYGEKNTDPLRWAPFVYYGRE